MVRLLKREQVESAAVTRSHVRYLLKGTAYLIDIDKWPRDDVEKLWQLVRPHVWESLIESLPGWRCWSWWQFEAPELKKQIAGAPATSTHTYFGEPTPRPWDARFESDEPYLDRLQLWQSGERDAFQATPSDEQLRAAINAILEPFPEA